jgi:RimJ/RimL family protein N-acetyltransferase
VPTLETDRLVLRAFRQDDFPAYAAIVGDPPVMRFIGDGRPLSPPDAWRNMAVILGHWQLRGYGLWAVEEKGTGELIGRIGCWNPEGWPGLEVGWLLRRASWGRGYATEGGRAALAFAFTALSAGRVISLIHPDNAPSVKVAGRLGERPAGRTTVQGREALVYEMTHHDWTAMRS